MMMFLVLLTVFIFQLIRFPRVSSLVDDSSYNVLTAKLLRHAHRYNKFRKAYSNFFDDISE